MADVRLTATNPVDSSVVPVACNEKGELKLEEPILVEGPQGEKGDKGDPGDPGANGDPFTGTFSGDVTFNGNQTLNGDLICGESRLYRTGSFGVSDGTNSMWTDMSVGATRWGSLDQLNSGTAAIQLNATNGSAGFCDGRADISPFIYASVNGVDKTTSRMTSGYFQSYVPSDHPDPAIDAGWTSFKAYDRAGISNLGLYANGGGHFGSDVIVGSRNRRWLLVESGGLCHMVDADATTFESSPRAQLPDIPQLRNIPAELTMVEEQLQKVMERLKMIPEAGWEVWDGED